MATKELTGRRLNELWGVGAKHALYRQDGKWYHKLKYFPGALFDANGYVVFTTREEYLGCKYLQIKQDLHVVFGIATIPGYVRVTERDQFQALSHRIRELSPKSRQYSITNQNEKAEKKSSAPRAPKAVDISEPGVAEHALVKAYRIIRDTEIARWVKYVHEYKCQICGTSIDLYGGEKYAEAHHIKPLGEPHNGPDVVENILCVCPNHHAQLDYGAIRLNMADLISVPGHEISNEYVEYHNTVVFRQGV